MLYSKSKPNLIEENNLPTLGKILSLYNSLNYLNAKIVKLNQFLWLVIGKDEIKYIACYHSEVLMKYKAIILSFSLVLHADFIESGGHVR